LRVFFWPLEACTEVQYWGSAAARALTGGMALASTDVAEPQDRKGSPPESCGASATRKLPGLMGSASLAHVGTRVPFSPHRLDRGTATAGGWPSAWLAAPARPHRTRPPSLQHLQRRNAKAGGVGRVAGKSAAASLRCLHAGRIGAGDASSPWPTASVLVIVGSGRCDLLRLPRARWKLPTG
jgi:hypothetical protein